MRFAYCALRAALKRHSGAHARLRVRTRNPETVHGAGFRVCAQEGASRNDGRSHIAMPALDGLADHRGGDLVGDLDVPEFGFALGFEVGEQFRDHRYLADLVAAQAEAARDIFQRRAAEHGEMIVDAVGAQLVEFRAVTAVVHGADQDAIALALQRLQLLDVEQQPAVAFEQHDFAAAALPPRGGYAERIAQAVADRAEFTHRGVTLRGP